MQSSIEPASKKVIDETIKTINNLLGWTPTERQLAKPTFNTVHEIVRRIVVETRILRDVYLPGELSQIVTPAPNGKVSNSRKLWDRRAKEEFVQKLMDFVSSKGHTLTPGSAAKLAAGLEPIKTNELLQALARIASKRRNSSSGSNPTSRKPSITNDGKTTAKEETMKSSSGSTTLTASSTTPRPSTYTKRTSNVNKNISPTNPNKQVKESNQLFDSPDENLTRKELYIEKDSNKSEVASGLDSKKVHLICDNLTKLDDQLVQLESIFISLGVKLHREFGDKPRHV